MLALRDVAGTGVAARALVLRVSDAATAAAISGQPLLSSLEPCMGARAATEVLAQSSNRQKAIRGMAAILVAWGANRGARLADYTVDA